MNGPVQIPLREWKVQALVTSNLLQLIQKIVQLLQQLPLFQVLRMVESVTLVIPKPSPLR